MTQRVFYQPEDGWVGDIIPWQEDGIVHLFFLHETRRDPALGMPWSRVTLDGNFHLVERGTAIASGGPGAPDFNIYTGSVVRDDDGVHHAFYTGQNPFNTGTDGRPLQLVMHATSTDGMRTWTRHPEHTFGAPSGYETGDWRDPFVYRDEEAGLWRMLVAARHARGPERRRGTIAQCVSRDLVSWEPVEPFWDPHRCITHECPEVFQWGPWWYLVHSEFSDAFCTRYLLSTSPDGPWRVPAHDTVDGRAFYAAKSAELNGRRFFFGWIATREGGSDDGAWQWAGTMSIIEALQRPDGTLDFRVPPEVAEAFDVPLAVTLTGEDSHAEVSSVPGALPDVETLAAPDGYAVAMTREVIPPSCRVTLTLDIPAGTRECGLVLRGSADGDCGYVLRLEPTRARMVIDRWPRRRTGGEQWQISGDVPFLVELERPCDLAPGLHTLDVITEDDICVATLDERVVLSTRLYDRKEGHLGIFVGEGSLAVVDLTVHTRH